MRKFSTMPQVRFNRSSFDLSHGHKTSISVGRLYPLDCQEVLPGDTFNSQMKIISRVSSAFLKPVMDNIFLDVYHFFVPLRLVYDNAEKVFGNASPSQYVASNLSIMPCLNASYSDGSGRLNGSNLSTTKEACHNVVEKSIADYLGLPIGKISIGKATQQNHYTNMEKGLISTPFRAFALIYDQWFRNENITDETYIYKGQFSEREYLNGDEFSPNNYTGLCPFVSKRKDYFTSALPSPQKGFAVDIPLSLNLPLTTGPSYGLPSTIKVQSSQAYGQELLLGTSSPNGSLYGFNNDSGNTLNSPIDMLNLYVNGSNATGFSVNDMRFAFQLQKMLERDALYGSRYNEYLLGHFGVSNPDSRLQFSEYLGGGRIPLNIQQVAQTSQGTEDSPLANLAGYSQSEGIIKYSKGFTEHGYVITVGCIRYLHTYSQGINKMWTRHDRNDFYDPLYANIGEQPIFTRELYAETNGTTPVVTDDSVFGYNEAWADYRYRPSQVSGQMRPKATDTLDIWHFGDNYGAKPTLSNSFIQETPMNVDRTLAVPSSSMDQFILDIWFKTRAIRVMPTYSVPGLIDHH